MKRVGLAVAIFFSLAVSSQKSWAAWRALPDQERTTTFSIEAYGRGIAYSANVDFLLANDLGFGVGFTSLPAAPTAGDIGNATAVQVVPVYLNFYLGEGNLRLFMTGGMDIILGGVLSSTAFQTGSTVPVLGAGLEYRSDGGFLFRMSPYVFIGTKTTIWGGISMGYAF